MGRRGGGYVGGVTEPDPAVDRTTGQVPVPHLSLGPEDRPKPSLPVRIVKRTVRIVLDILSLP